MQVRLLACLLTATLLGVTGMADATDKAKTPSASAVKKAKELVEKGNKMDDAGKTEKAMSAYKSAIKLNPQSFEANFNLGFAQLKSGDHVAAETSLKAATALDPKDSEAFKLLGVACIKQGKQDEALGAWKTSLELDPKQPDVKKFLEMHEAK